MTDVLAVAATTAGLTMAVSPILQIRRMLATGSSADFSIGYISVLVVGFTLWLSYGLAIGNAALIISNIAALSVGLLTIFVAVRLRIRRRDQADDAGPH
jgi:MtN3 and saliva related transmembrane protein